MVRVLLDSGADVKVKGISYVGFGRRLVTGRCDIAAGGDFDELVVDLLVSSVFLMFFVFCRLLFELAELNHWHPCKV